jgi:hypothetical protein
MARPGHQQSNIADLDFSLGGFDWVDRDKSLWPLFALWLIKHWHRLYRRSLNSLPGVSIDIRKKRPKLYKPASLTWGDAYGAMEKALKRLAVTLPKYSSSEQLALVHAEAKKLGLNTDRGRVEGELERFLTFQPYPEFAPLLKASPWCNYFANQQHIFEQAGQKLPYKYYPRDPVMRLALENVISEFGSIEISRGVSPELAKLLAVRRQLAQLVDSVKCLPAKSALLVASQEAEPKLQKFVQSLELEITERITNHSDALTHPLHDRRLQRALFFAARRLCKPSGGASKLAAFIQNLLKQWPQLPAGLGLDLKEHFNVEVCRRILREHLGLANGQVNKDFRALSHVLLAIIWREDLRASLLRLACYARQRAEERRKGWEHLHNVLEAVFKHICHESSMEEQIRDFERANFPGMRNLTREQRMQLLPELGNDPNHAVRDLTKKERMILAQRVLAGGKTCKTVSTVNLNSYATQYGRAMKAVRKELGQG